MTKIPVEKPFIDRECIDGVINILKSGILVFGPKAVEEQRSRSMRTNEYFYCFTK